MMRFLALPLAVHGMAHLVGFLGAFRLSEAAPYPNFAFGGTLALGEATVKVLGLLWLACAFGFLTAALGVGTRSDWWPSFTIASTVVSLLLCIVCWPEARIGAAVDVAILAAMLTAKWSTWLLGVD